MEATPRGMLLLDKPVGLTSFQALGACKRLFGTKKVGHAGTLDKFASGLLLVFANEATRLVPWFVGLDKTYRAAVRFGAETATLDPEGAVVREAPVPDGAAVSRALPSFIGRQLQVPPRYSAIHVDGRRAYERTLAGEELELEPREVTIHTLEPHGYADGTLDLSVSCSSGTYVRSLARDVGMACGSAASLAALRRERVGGFSVTEAVLGPADRESPPPQLTASSWYAGRRLAEALAGPGLLLLRPACEADFHNGKPLREALFSTEIRQPQEGVSDWAVVDEAGGFAGIVCRSAEGWSYRLVFPAG